MLPDANTTCLTRAARLALALAASSFVPAAHADDGWRSSFTIYGWLPGVDAELGVPVDTGTAVSKSNTDILDNLRGALMLSFDTHNGDWGFYGDGDWVKFSNQEGTFRSIGGQHVDAALNTRWDFKGGLITLAGLYTLTHSPSGYTDLVFGGRYFWVKTNVKWDFTLSGGGGNLDIANSGNEDLVFVAPEDGCMIWADNMLIPNLATHQQLAEDWINFYYDPLHAAQLASFNYYICPVKGAQEEMEKFDPSAVDNTLIFPTPESLKATHTFMPLSEAQIREYEGDFADVIGG